MNVLRSIYSNPFGQRDNLSADNSAFHISATSYLRNRKYMDTDLPQDSIFSRYPTFSANELYRNNDQLHDDTSHFNDLQQLTGRNFLNLSLCSENPAAVPNEEPGSSQSLSFTEIGGLTSFWNGRYPVSVIARRNERERNRVKTINQTFAKLRHHLPSGTGKRRKLSKVQILRLAIQYIHQLQKILESETDKETETKTDSQPKEPINNGSLMTRSHDAETADADETSSSVASSSSHLSHSDSYKYGALTDNAVSAPRSERRFKETSGNDVQLDKERRLLMDPFGAYPADFTKDRLYENLTEFLM